MSTLRFCIIDRDYIEKLKTVEESSRGYTRVPNVVYSESHKMKFLCGPVIETNGVKYFAPISSNKTFHESDFQIYLDELRVGAIRFNYMIPVPDGCYTQVDFSKESDRKFKFFITAQWRYCSEHVDEIQKKATDMYERVVSGKESFLCENSCDFGLLESVCRTWTKNHNEISFSAAQVALDVLEKNIWNTIDDLRRIDYSTPIIVPFPKILYSEDEVPLSRLFLMVDPLGSEVQIFWGVHDNDRLSKADYKKAIRDDSDVRKTLVRELLADKELFISELISSIYDMTDKPSKIYYEEKKTWRK